MGAIHGTTCNNQLKAHSQSVSTSSKAIHGTNNQLKAHSQKVSTSSKAIHGTNNQLKALSKRVYRPAPRRYTELRMLFNKMLWCVGFIVLLGGLFLIEVSGQTPSVTPAPTDVECGASGEYAPGSRYCVQVRGLDTHSVSAVYTLIKCGWVLEDTFEVLYRKNSAGGSRNIHCVVGGLESSCQINMYRGLTTEIYYTNNFRVGKIPKKGWGTCSATVPSETPDCAALGSTACAATAGVTG